MKHLLLLKTFRPKLFFCGLFAVAFLIVASVFLFPSLAKTKTITAKDVLSGKVIAIDPGHGGRDPGAIGVTGTLEKDVNLAIGLKLQKILQHYGAEVIITRTQDKDCGDSKKDDLNARAALVETAKADIFIGVQCNAIPDTSCHGAQVFFYPQSAHGEILAKEIQTALWKKTEQTKKREAQTISSPYILYTLTVPAVIVECGFLSNAQEEALLIDEAYQKKIAVGIAMGIVGYYKTTAPVFSLFSL